MKQAYLRKALWLGLSLAALQAHGQYQFKSTADASSNGLGPYRQNFDALAGSSAGFSSNATLPGVYARYTLGSSTTEYESGQRVNAQNQPYIAPLTADDGSKGDSRDANDVPNGADWYHFGKSGATDRAFGGIAATNTTPGVGYIGVRLKNSSGKVIKNLEVEYAMEQWYNSSRTQSADVAVAYRRSTSAITTLVAGTWTAISALNVAAPSTSTAIAPRDGNAATNRRVMRTTLTGLNLADGEEIMLRWSYTFNSTTNGNGLSIDDVVITPQTNIYYSSATATAKLDNKNTWGTNTDGSGSSPSNFGADNTVYYVQGTGTTSRITGTWTVTGANSKIIVGTPATPATLYVGPSDQIAGKVDLNPGSTLQIQQASTDLTLGSVSNTSTVEYLFPSNGTSQNVQGGSYGTLKLTGAGARSLSADALINAGLAFSTTAGTQASLALGASDLTLIKGTSLSGLDGANTLIVTDGSGLLRQTVTNNGQAVLFPVASTANTAAYTPAYLSQPTSAQLSEDTYGVRVIDNAYHSYDANEAGLGTAIAGSVVRNTWLVSEEVPGNSDVTLRLSWDPARQTTDFVGSRAFIDHYSGGKWQGVGTTPGTTTYNGLPTVARTGITSFSPFGVSSSPGLVLPVELLHFAARRAPGGVICTWATAQERNAARFEVERSLDARTFVAVGTVAAAGTTAQRHDYQLTDAQPARALAYYRLHQVDADGSETWSNVVTVAPEAAALTVAPNPGTGLFDLWTDAPAGTPLLLTVHSALGTEVQRQSLMATAQPLPLDLRPLPAGIYFVRVSTAAGQQTVRVLKQ